MSNDLISRSAVVKIIEDEIKLKSSYVEHNAQIDIMFKVKEMPTSYDADKVVERLEEEARCNQSEANKLAKHGDYGTATMLQGIAKGYKYSADIVKSGGIE